MATATTTRAHSRFDPGTNLLFAGRGLPQWLQYPDPSSVSLPQTPHFMRVHARARYKMGQVPSLAHVLTTPAFNMALLVRGTKEDMVFTHVC